MFSWIYGGKKEIEETETENNSVNEISFERIEQKPFDKNEIIFPDHKNLNFEAKQRTSH